MKILGNLMRGTTLAALLLAGFPLAQPDAARAETASFCWQWDNFGFCIGTNSDGKACIATANDIWCSG